MPIIYLGKVCNMCGRGGRPINITVFKRDMFKITNGTIAIWNDKKCCWKCKAKPLDGETWGMSMNGPERNRLFCPTCAEWMEAKLEMVKH